MSNTNPSAFASLFDIGVREQVQLALCNSSSDTFFLLSGPPAFGDSTSTGAANFGTNMFGHLCPLLFAMTFTDSENKAPDQQIGSFGTSNTVTAPSPFTPSYKAVSVGAAAYVTASPCADAAGRADSDATVSDYLKSYIDVSGTAYLNKWNLLKRVYYWLLKDKETVGSIDDGQAFYDLYIGDEGVKPNAVAPDAVSIWGNFAKSDLYKIPFGLMAIAADKSRRGQVVRYYEGCVLQNAGGTNIDAGLGRVTTYLGTQGFSCTYSKVRTFTAAEIDLMVKGATTSDNANFLDKVIAKWGQGPASTTTSSEGGGE